MTTDPTQQISLAKRSAADAVLALHVAPLLHADDFELEYTLEEGDQTNGRDRSDTDQIAAEVGVRF